MPQNGINIANANGNSNQITQNMNQNALGVAGLTSSMSPGTGGLVWLPQNGVNIVNANGNGNQISQNMNQNAFGA